MKVGIIGLGDIAKKAYLPIVSRMGLDIVLCSRNETAVAQIAEEYGIKEYCFQYEELLDYSIQAVFIHTATKSHYGIIKFFLENKIHVYVDKPISDRLEETIELYEIALEENLALMVGFNRRYSPRVQELMALDKPEILMIQKNRHNEPGEIRTFIYDDFIHVVDTLLFLFRGQEVEFDYNSRIIDDKLQHVMLMLQGVGATAIGSMNRMSGKKEERIEYMAKNEKYCIEDLDITAHYMSNEQRTIKFDDWTSVLKRRGFEDCIRVFFKYVENPKLAQQDLELSLRTHEVCEYLVMELEQ